VCDHDGVLRIGLTGGIGAGKSVVAARLGELGALVIDADRIAREVVEPGTSGLAAVVETFGESILTADGSLDRAALGRIVFADGQRRRQLDDLLHPLIARRTDELVRRAEPGVVLVHDVPLLVEKGMAAGYDLVIVVHAPQEERVRRLVRDRGMAPQEARARIDSQADDERRRAVADVWLENTGSIERLRAGVDALWRDRIRPLAESRRREGTTAPPE
jgi:dephospho-CoA kinase